MKQVTQFFTIFWIIYFPTCIAYYDAGFISKYVDEIMTLILVAFTTQNLFKKFVVKEPRHEYYTFFIVLAFFIAYSLVFGENISTAVWRDAVQWVRPFSVIYCTWLLNPQFTDKQKNYMIYSMILTLVAWLAYHPVVTMMTFSEEFATLGQMAICTGMTWYLFHDDTKTNRWIALIFAASGLLAPKFKYLGELVCFVYMVFFLKKKLNFKSIKTWIPMSIVVGIIIYVTWFKFNAYYIEGFSRVGSERMARPASYQTALLIFKDYFPFGSGLGSFGSAAAADFYSPLYYKYGLTKIWGLSPELPFFVADAFYPVLAQIGIVGTILFGIFWKRRLYAFNEIKDMRYYRVAWIAFFCLALEQTADTSFLSGKGMGYCMLIGLCLNANRNIKRNSNAPEMPENQKPDWRKMRYGRLIEEDEEQAIEVEKEVKA